MDYLREGIHLRGFAQIEPIVAYKNEAFTLFQDLMNTIWADFTRMVFNLEFEAVDENEQGAQRYETSGTSTRPGRVSYSGGSAAGPSALALAAAGGAADGREYYEDEELPPPVEQRVLAEEEQVGRNDPCWCGSGKKFKKCHGA
jgi:preprotein translocase subunit SecA